MTHAARAFVSASLFLSIYCGLGHAAEDRIHLNTGEVLEGEILEQTDSHVRLRYSVTPRIKDEKSVPKNTIIRIEKVPEDEKALARIKEELPIADRSTVGTYDEFLNNRLVAFVSDHPDSKLRGEIEKIADDIKAEREKIASGFIKINGEFVSSTDYEANRITFESEAVLNDIKSLISRKKFVSGLREFEEFEEEYVGSIHHPEAIRFVLEEGLPAYKQEIDSIGQVFGAKEFERNRVMKLETPDALRASRAIEGEKMRFMKLQETESSETWKSYHEFDIVSIQNATVAIGKETQRLSEIDLEQLTKANEGLTDARTALAKGNHASALLALAKADLHGADKTVSGALRKEALGFQKKEDEAKSEAEAAERKRQQSLSTVNKATSTTTSDADSGNSGGGLLSGLKNRQDAIQDTANASTSGEADPAAALKKREEESAAKKAAEEKAKAAEASAGADAKAAPRTPRTPPVAQAGEPGTPLWRKILFAVAALLIIATLAAKVLGIGDGKKKKTAEES